MAIKTIAVVIGLLFTSLKYVAVGFALIFIGVATA